VPKVVFIVPYRDREEHLTIFLQKMAYVLEDVPKTDYKIYVAHQNDKREFNRGAIKNIGFLYVKNKYPEDYSNITLVFNDVDTMPTEKHTGFSYQTTVGTIKHFCGYVYALGGIVSITGHDFERINGFPNFWAWGYEDNTLQHRAMKHRIQIDRSVFVDFSNSERSSLLTTEGQVIGRFISLSSGYLRTVNKTEYQRYIQTTREGVHSIRNIDMNETSVPYENQGVAESEGRSKSAIFGRDAVSYENQGVAESEGRSKSAIFGRDAVSYENVSMINITQFDTGVNPHSNGNLTHDLRKGSTPFGKIMYRRNGILPKMNMCL
jgi:hypothetical protein